MQGIIVQSGNDACITLAEGLMGSEDDFVILMNAKAKELGLKNTHFVNSTGWPDQGLVMSVIDIAILSRHIIRDFPEYYHWFSQKNFTHQNIKQNNRNMLLFKNNEVDGIKTGRTDKGGYSTAVSAVRKNRRLIAVLNGLKSDSDRTKEAERLLNYGFEYFNNVLLYGKDEMVAETSVWLGKQSYLPLITNKEVLMTLPRHTIKNYSVIIDYDAPIHAPIEKNSKLGTVKIVNHLTNKVLMEHALYAQHHVDILPFGMQIITRLQYYLSELFGLKNSNLKMNDNE